MLTDRLLSCCDLHIRYTPGCGRGRVVFRHTTVPKGTAMPFGQFLFLLFLLTTATGAPPLSSLQVVMLRNDIHHCKASGMFRHLLAGGLIADNKTHSKCEAGVGICKGATALVLLCPPPSCAGGQVSLFFFQVTAEIHVPVWRTLTFC